MVAPHKHIRTPPVPEYRYSRGDMRFLTLLIAHLGFISMSRFLDDVDKRWLNSSPLLGVDLDTVPMVLRVRKDADQRLVRRLHLVLHPWHTCIFTSLKVHPGKVVCVFRLAEKFEGGSRRHFLIEVIAMMTTT